MMMIATTTTTTTTTTQNEKESAGPLTAEGSWLLHWHCMLRLIFVVINNG